MTREPPQRPQLLVGPVLRYAVGTRATVFVETDVACTVEVRPLDPVTPPGPGGAGTTWSVHGHHYCVVVVDGLTPGVACPYEVRLDGVAVWPPPGWGLPPSTIRTPASDGRLRVTFGSCRALAGYDDESMRKYGADALLALGERLRHVDPDARPDLLLHGGDQVYADEPPPDVRRRLVARHRARGAGAARETEDTAEIHDFEEYTWLYHRTWGVPVVRWLLSTVPNAMMFDDHDLRDDWNTSAQWRAEMAQQPWWRDRVVGGLGSYWVYQHLGNLAPDDLVADPLLRAVRAAAGDAEASALLDAFALRADADPASARWSYARDVSGTRLVVLDTRCSRQLAPDDRRALLDDTEWSWVRAALVAPPRPAHILIGTSLPAFLPYGVHHVEGANEAVAAGAWGRTAARLAERVRRHLDLEHWAAFRRSFDALVALLRELAAADDHPATVLVLSGDVHFSYTSQVQLDGGGTAGCVVHQLVHSPMRNPLPPAVVLAFRGLRHGAASRMLRPLARAAGVPDPPVQWELHRPMSFANGLMTLTLSGRHAHVSVDEAHVGRGGRHALVRHGRHRLT